MRFKITALFLYMIFFLVIIGTDFLYAQNSSRTRGYYWDVPDRGTQRDADQVRYINSLGIKEVHIWLNGNEATLPCGARWEYSEGGGRLWTAPRLEAFTRTLKEAGLIPIFTLSPRLHTKSYIESLSDENGPLGIASRVRGVAIELDIEGNGDSAALCPNDGLTTDQADRAILEAIHSASPGLDLIVTTVPRHTKKHPVLMGKGGATVISPQLYGAHYANSLPETRSTLRDFLIRYPDKTILPGLSVECSEADALRQRCSERLFADQFNIVAAASKENPKRIKGYVVWGEREIHSCPHLPLCSTFGQNYLKNHAGITVD